MAGATALQMQAVWAWFLVGSWASHMEWLKKRCEAMKSLWKQRLEKERRFLEKLLISRRDINEVRIDPGSETWFPIHGWGFLSTKRLSKTAETSGAIQILAPAPLEKHQDQVKVQSYKTVHLSLHLQELLPFYFSDQLAINQKFSWLLSQVWLLC